MKISQIKISNISTFPYIKHFSDKQGVVFDTKERNNLNILIWPNWSWKSTFLDVINQVFRVGLIKSYRYDKSILDNNDKKNFKNVITIEPVRPKKFYKHSESQWKLSKVYISLKLSQYDFENINFVSENYETLNEIIKNYSELDIVFPEYKDPHLLLNNEIFLEFTINTKTWEITITNEEAMPNSIKYILFYIQHIELIQICINVFNDFARKPDQKKLHALKNTFAFLKSERPFLYTQTNTNPLIIDTILNRSQNIEMHNKDKFSSVSIWYDLFVIKVLKKIKEQYSSMWKNFEDISIDEKVSLIQNVSFFKELAKHIESLLWFVMDIDIWLDERIYIIFKNREWIKFSFEKLSSWEKSIIMILFSLFGYDLSNGLFIIDEPELHLHPYMLKRLVATLKEIWKQLNMQFICATHSPLLIDEQSIHNVYKFSIVDGKTVVNYPVEWIRDSESSLIHILKFENISKIFFINKIIMVEWETDEYFRKFYMNYLSTQPEFQWKFEDYEILNINWKWSYRKWTRFLNKFGIKWYFIWDWDNTIENDIVTPQEMSEYIKLAKNQYSMEQINKQKFYTRIISIIKKDYPHRYKYIITKIKSFYDKWIFIMKKWDLETYLALDKKWLEPTINFCNHWFYYLLHDERMAQYREEFEEIVKNIFK